MNDRKIGDPTIFEDAEVEYVGDFDEISELIKHLPEVICGEFRFKDKLSQYTKPSEIYQRMMTVPLEEAAIVMVCLGRNDEERKIYADFAFVPWATLAYQAYNAFPERCKLVMRRVKMEFNGDVKVNDIIAIDMEYDSSIPHSTQENSEYSTDANEGSSSHDDRIDGLLYGIERVRPFLEAVKSAGVQFQKVGREKFSIPVQKMLDRIADDICSKDDVFHTLSQ